MVSKKRVNNQKNYDSDNDNNNSTQRKVMHGTIKQIQRWPNVL